MPTVALTELLGAPVYDTAGARCGRVRELALVPQEDRARVAIFIVKTKAGNRLLPAASSGESKQLGKGAAEAELVEDDDAPPEHHR